MTRGTSLLPDPDRGASLKEHYARIREAIAASPAPAVRTGVRVAWMLALVPLFSAAVVFAAARLLSRSPLRAELARFGPLLAGATALTLVATFIATRRGRSGLGSGIVALLAIALLATPAFAALSLAAAIAAPPPAAAQVAGLSPFGLPCIGISVAVGGVALAAYAVALRRAVPVATVRRAAALGAAAGCWPGLAVLFFCPANDLVHLLVAHVLPILGLTLVGAVVLPPALRP